jgi:hypothetical protein
MALDPRKRQRKLEQKKAKHKAAKAKERERHQMLAPDVPRRLVAAAADCPVYEAHASRDIFEAGMGHVVLSRRLPLGQLATVCFLVDVWCLGVKDLFVRKHAPGEFRYLVDQLDERQPMRPVSGAYARKLVEECVRYAQGLGLPPYADYAWAQGIFAGIDTAECTETFEFGHKGKPFYVSGPFDSPEKVQRILSAVGPGNLEFLVKVSEADAPSLGWPGNETESDLGETANDTIDALAVQETPTANDHHR